MHRGIRGKTQPNYKTVGELQQKRRDAVRDAARGITRHTRQHHARWEAKGVPRATERPLGGLEKLLTCERITYGPVHC